MLDLSKVSSPAHRSQFYSLSHSYWHTDSFQSYYTSSDHLFSCNQQTSKSTLAEVNLSFFPTNPLIGSTIIHLFSELKNFKIMELEIILNLSLSLTNQWLHSTGILHWCVYETLLLVWFSYHRYRLVSAGTHSLSSFETISFYTAPCLAFLKAKYISSGPNRRHWIF